MSLKGLQRIYDHESLDYLGDDFYNSIAKKVGFKEVMPVDQNTPTEDQIGMDMINGFIIFLVDTHNEHYIGKKGYPKYKNSLFLSYDGNGEISSCRLDGGGSFIQLKEVKKYIRIAEKFIKLLNEKGLELEEIPDDYVVKSH